MSNKKDLYLAWTESGKLKDNLAIISLLIKAGVTEAQIAKYLEISLKDYKEMKKAHADVAYANAPDNIWEMTNCIRDLVKIGHGYSTKSFRKQVYKGKKGEDKYSINEFELYHEPNANVLIYILDKFYGPKWRDDAISLELRKEKLDQKEEWNSGSSNDGNK